MTHFRIQTYLHVLGTKPNDCELHEAQRSIQTDNRSTWACACMSEFSVKSHLLQIAQLTGLALHSRGWEGAANGSHVN